MASFEFARTVVLESLAVKAYQQAPRGRKFRLSSGRESKVIVDASLALRHWKAFSVLPVLLAEVIPDDLDFDVVAGPSSGADPLCAAALSVNLGERWCSIRKEKKRHGFDTGLVTGPIQKGDRALLFEDVLTTGRSLALAIEAMRAADCTVVGAVVLVDRNEFGGRRTIENLIKPAKLISVFTLAEIRTFRKQHKIS